MLNNNNSNTSKTMYIINNKPYIPHLASNIISILPILFCIVYLFFWSSAFTHNYLHLYL